MGKKICFIFGAGEQKIPKNKFPTPDFIIASDGGYKVLEEYKIVPDLLVGDFDSLSYVPNCDIKKLNVEKDETDTFICINEAIKLGSNEIFLFCCTGGRIDHTFANIQSLIHIAKNNAMGYLIDGDYIITALPVSKPIAFSEKASGMVSIFSADTEVYDVSILGLKYALNGATLTNCFPLGVSNQFIGKKSKIVAQKGILLVVFPSQAFSEIIR